MSFVWRHVTSVVEAGSLTGCYCCCRRVSVCVVSSFVKASLKSFQLLFGLLRGELGSGTALAIVNL